MKICTIIGARPQFIKAAIVGSALGYTAHCLIHTGQHYDANMSDIFFAELGIPAPDHNLGIGGGSHGQNTGRMIEAIEAVLLAEKPACVLVYGDTDSTLAGALAAVKLHIPVAHVEAGLRSRNRRMPEEINRILTDHAADLLFAPTQAAMDNLAAEGLQGHLVGDVMYDAALHYGAAAQRQSTILARLGLAEKSYVLATLHRPENTDDAARLRAIMDGFAASRLPVILPLHPRTAKMLQKFSIAPPPSVRAIDPVGYLDMVMLERNAALIATDSGGMQKEAYFYAVPCLTLRDQTEWVELVAAGANRLTGADTARIAAVLNEPPPAFTPAPLYGSGQSGVRIAALLKKFA